MLFVDRIPRMAEAYADSVMEQIHELSVQQLVELCDKYGVTVPDEKKERRGALVLLLTTFIAGQQVSADGGEDVLEKLDGDIGKMLKKPKVKLEGDQSKSSDGKAADVAGVTDKTTEKTADKTTEKTAEQKSSKTRDSDTEIMKQRMELLRGLRVKEFKVDGHVGRTAGCLQWRDLEFQIKKGQSAGHTFDEIRNGVIKAMKTGSSIHTYFIGKVDEDVEEEEFLELLQDYHIIQDATEIFNEMAEASQEPDEFPSDYALRVLGMCKNVIKLSAKEDCEYPEPFVRKKCFHALSVGFIEQAIRADLKDILQDTSKTDKEILAAVSYAEARDREYKKRMKGKLGSVNNVYTKRDRGNEDAGRGKDRGNEDAGRGRDRTDSDAGKGRDRSHDDSNREKTRSNDVISRPSDDPLLAAMAKMSSKMDDIGKVVHRVDKLEAGLARVEEQLARSSPTVNPPGTIPVIPAVGGGGGGARRRIKCQPCEDGNVRYCRHCNKCGEEGHQRKDCPN